MSQRGEPVEEDDNLRQQGEEPKPKTWRSRLALILETIGLSAVYHSSRDTKLLILQRSVRFFGYGGSTVVLVPFFAELGISDTKKGLFMTLTLVGDVLISFLLTLVADNCGRRFILKLGSILMTGSGIVFGFTTNYWFLLAAAILGVITPSGNEIGPFRAIEESTIAHLTNARDRASIFAWYTMVGILGSAVGIISCGWLSTWLHENHHWSLIQTYKLVFFFYAAIGGIKLFLTFMLSDRCEIDKPKHDRSTPERESQPVNAEGEPEPTVDETTALLGNGNAANAPSTWASRLAKLFPVRRESRIVLSQLALLFALDSFASGLAPLSWMTSYFKRQFDLSVGWVGTLFFVSMIVSCFSVIASSPIAKKLGNVKAMVYTHLPSAICLAMLPFPSQLWLAALLLFLRSSSQSMDTAPRSAFLSAIVAPEERTATMGILNVVKTLSQSLGPFIAGLLVENDLFWVAFFTAGSLKAIYDLFMLYVFASHQPQEDREEPVERR